MQIKEAIASAEAQTPTVTSIATSTSSSTSSTAPRSSSSGILSALKQAGDMVEEGMGLIRSCQKAIWLADRSELGWATVNKYGEDKMANDSDDEKRIAKTMATAEKKAAQLKKNQDAEVL